MLVPGTKTPRVTVATMKRSVIRVDGGCVSSRMPVCEAPDPVNPSTSVEV
jgi:hypothetical protein